jgi:hypothetical protein
MDVMLLASTPVAKETNVLCLGHREKPQFRARSDERESDHDLTRLTLDESGNRRLSTQGGGLDGAAITFSPSADS